MVGFSRAVPRTQKPFLPSLGLRATDPDSVVAQTPLWPSTWHSLRPATAQWDGNTHSAVGQARRSAREHTVVSAFQAKVHRQLEC